MVATGGDIAYNITRLSIAKFRDVISQHTIQQVRMVVAVVAIVSIRETLFFDEIKLNLLGAYIQFLFHINHLIIKNNVR